MSWMPRDYLFAARQALIIWTRLSVWPLEYAFDCIEDELEARGHKLKIRSEAGE